MELQNLADHAPPKKSFFTQKHSITIKPPTPVAEFYVYLLYLITIIELIISIVKSYFSLHEAFFELINTLFVMIAYKQISFVSCVFYILGCLIQLSLNVNKIGAKYQWEMLNPGQVNEEFDDETHTHL